jgi:hypothetical protein
MAKWHTSFFGFLLVVPLIKKIDTFSLWSIPWPIENT